MIMSNFSIVLVAVLLSAIVLWRLKHYYRLRIERERGEQDKVFQVMASVVSGLKEIDTGIAGIRQYHGEFDGQQVEIKLITDTLQCRKLPSLWLMATIRQPTSCKRTLDLIMRPAGMVSFSNFHLLEHVIKSPSFLKTDHPQLALQIHSDKAGEARELEPLSQIEGLFDLPQLKEILITPNGTRLVALLAEADRARYGILREADFSARPILAHEISNWLGKLVALNAIFGQNLQHANENHAGLQERKAAGFKGAEALGGADNGADRQERQSGKKQA